MPGETDKNHENISHDRRSPSQNAKPVSSETALPTAEPWQTAEWWVVGDVERGVVDTFMTLEKLKKTEQNFTQDSL
jgi:hypothetical protein